MQKNGTYSIILLFFIIFYRRVFWAQPPTDGARGGLPQLRVLPRSVRVEPQLRVFEPPSRQVFELRLRQVFELRLRGGLPQLRVFELPQLRVFESPSRLP